MLELRLAVRVNPWLPARSALSPLVGARRRSHGRLWPRPLLSPHARPSDAGPAVESGNPDDDSLLLNIGLRASFDCEQQISGRELFFHRHDEIIRRLGFLELCLKDQQILFRKVDG
jgi:hypothetical protein